MSSKAKVRTGKNTLHRKGKLANKGKPSYTKHGGKQGTTKAVGHDVKRLNPMKRKLPKGKSAGAKRDVYLQKRFDKARRKMFGLSRAEDGGSI